ncbi:5-carboxymethyl-2-hydroxymuconate Delta-isomerase [Heyndrickxia acidicola]|uniref:5-carboxymethyl-2-hydroxymuconate Delta-isomerase n=1 Tax=Heyndrickxia acidicola TaxID=209389 RepID=A0ABU6MAE3_9BACI|nr:5-carboxymethyl-2-hydroxymuconate Delta-isomerase [Heyndrickxia acidicola]MED1201586.1 5-carboxymethyl-2-hydroxymuconate Delta-isomerase [Heyndrickxia acidicola]
MPHVIIEYTDNLKDEFNLQELMEKIHSCLIRHSEIFPVGGIRSRAIELNHYRVADGKENDAFVHTTLKIGAGRSEEIKKEITEEIFKTISVVFEPLFQSRYLALSLELYEFPEKYSLKHNNIHARFKQE